MKVHLVDGTYELFRHYFAVPKARDARGREVGAVRRVLASLLAMMRGGVTHIGVATDHVIESFRNNLWAGYKTSEGVEPDLLSQFPILEEVLGFCRNRGSLLFFALTTRCRAMRQALNPVVAKVLKRLHYPLDVILLCVRWYSAYPLSLRNLEEMMAERGISVDHSTVHRWAIKLLPVLEREFRRSKHKVGKSLRMDETYIKVQGEWKYLYRAVDKAGATVDFLLRAHRDKAAARMFFEQAIEQNGAPEKVTIDKSGSNVAALEAINAGRRKRIVVRQIKYLNNIVEQDHRAIKRRTRPMLGFKDFRCARILLSGIELMHMIRKGQMKNAGKERTPAQNFYSLAA